MTKHEKLEKAQRDHGYAVERIGELERELSDMRFKLRSVRQELKYATGQEKRPEAYEHHY